MKVIDFKNISNDCDIIKFRTKISNEYKLRNNDSLINEFKPLLIYLKHNNNFDNYEIIKGERPDFVLKKDNDEIFIEITSLDLSETDFANNQGFIIMQSQKKLNTFKNCAKKIINDKFNISYELDFHYNMNQISLAYQNNQLDNEIKKLLSYFENSLVLDICKLNKSIKNLRCYCFIINDIPNSIIDGINFHQNNSPKGGFSFNVLYAEQLITCIKNTIKNKINKYGCKEKDIILLIEHSPMQGVDFQCLLNDSQNKIIEIDNFNIEFKKCYLIHFNNIFEIFSRTVFATADSKTLCPSVPPLRNSV